MIGDRDVFVAELLAGQHHCFDAVAAIAPGRMHVEVAADMAFEHEPGQRVAFSGLDLVISGAQLRRNERQIESIVEVVFRRAPYDATIATREPRLPGPAL